MNLSYEVKGSGYVILNNKIPWIVQKTYIPYKGKTIEESAKNHILELLKENNVVEQPNELELKVNQQEQAIAELTMLVSMNMA